ncbi:MAG: hypothetical protein ACLRMJ_01135 [Alistipes finegoldii]
MLHGKQGRRHGIRHAEGQLHRRRFDRRRIGRHFPDAGCALRPQAGDFTLTVTGESGTQQWDTLTEFEQSDAVFRMGTYAVSVAHGDPDAEESTNPIMPRRRASRCSPAALQRWR